MGFRFVTVPLQNNATVVVDCENWTGSGLFFIDMLTDWLGTGSPANRTIKWSLDQLAALGLQTEGVIIPTRKYSDTQKYINTLPYINYTDTMAIHASGTSAKKL